LVTVNVSVNGAPPDTNPGGFNVTPRSVEPEAMTTAALAVLLLWFGSWTPMVETTAVTANDPDGPFPTTPKLGEVQNDPDVVAVTGQLRVLETALHPDGAAPEKESPESRVIVAVACPSPTSPGPKFCTVAATVKGTLGWDVIGTPFSAALRSAVMGGTLAGSNVAVTVVSTSRVSVQAPVPVQPPPLQPPNVIWASGAAVRVTEVPVGCVIEHAAPQLIPPGLLVTDPVPEPALLRFKVRSTAAFTVTFCCRESVSPRTLETVRVTA